MIMRFGRLRTTRTDSDSTTWTRRGSLPTSAANAIASAVGVTVARSTVRPSAFETIFWAITTTSPSRNVRPANMTAFAMRDGRSSPADTIGTPGIAKTCRRLLMISAMARRLVEALAQLRQHLLAVQFQEPGLIGAGCVEHQMTEAHFDVRFDFLDVLIRIGGHDPAAGGAFDRQSVGQTLHLDRVLDLHLFLRCQRQRSPM